MKQILYLDDSPERQEKFSELYPDSTRVWNAADCIKALKEKEWNTVSLDMDLEGIPYDDPLKDNSGAAVVRWILQNRPKVEKFIIHSYNHFLSPSMVEMLKSAGYDNTVWEPFNL